MSLSGRQLDFPATERNREVIADTLATFWPPDEPLDLLEVASGSGQHVVFFASRFPRWTFQPSDLRQAHLESIVAYRAERSMANVKAPLELDVGARPWRLPQRYGAVLAINLIHISPWRCTLDLFAESRDVLTPGGALYLYGAFRRQGRHTAPSNQAFDQHLQGQNCEWGVRCLDEVVEFAARPVGFRLESVTEMPANNLSVLFRLT